MRLLWLLELDEKVKSTPQTVDEPGAETPSSPQGQSREPHHAEQLTATVAKQQHHIEDLTSRVIRLETALELALGAKRPKKLPAPASQQA